MNKIYIGGKEVTRGEVSRLTGISMSHVSRIFSGQRSPSMKTVTKIAEKLGVQTADVVKWLEARQGIRETVERVVNGGKRPAA